MFSSLFAVKVTKQYQSPDPKFSVTVPENWSITDESRGFVCLSQDAIGDEQDYYPQLFIEVIESGKDGANVADIIDAAIADYPEMLKGQGYSDPVVLRSGQVTVNNRTLQALVITGMMEQTEVKILQYITTNGSDMYILSFFVKGSDYPAQEALFTEILHSVKIGN
jgi:hypothetical protein